MCILDFSEDEMANLSSWAIDLQPFRRRASHSMVVQGEKHVAPEIMTKGTAIYNNPNPKLFSFRLFLAGIFLLPGETIIA